MELSTDSLDSYDETKHDAVLKIESDVISSKNIRKQRIK